MRGKDNYSPSSSRTRRGLLADVGHTAGPLPQRMAADIAAHLGFTLHHVSDLPHSTRSVTDLKHRRIYLPSPSARRQRPPLGAAAGARAPRAGPRRARATTASSCASGSRPTTWRPPCCSPRRPRVEFLQRGQERARQSPSRTCATPSRCPTRPPRTASPTWPPAPGHPGALPEDPRVAASSTRPTRTTACGSRSDHSAPSRASTCAGTGPRARCSTSTDQFSAVQPVHGHAVGHLLVHLARGRTRPTRESSRVRRRAVRAREVVPRGARRPSAPPRTCPDESCCRRPPQELAEKWGDNAWPSARPHASLLAAMPPGAFPGVETTEVYRFLERHAPED